MRNVIQIGLYKSAEWTFLTSEHWVQLMLKEQPRHYHLPDFFTENPEPFRYFGIDSSPSAISYVTERFTDRRNNVFFLVCGVAGEFNIHNYANEKYHDNMGWYEWYKECQYTLFAFMPLQFIIENIGIEDLSILAIDVGGHEDEMFGNIANWKIKPELITVEVYALRPDEYEPRFQPLLTENGYVHIKTMPQFTKAEVQENDMRAMQHEQQFLRHDLYTCYRDQIKIEHTIYEDT